MRNFRGFIVTMLIVAWFGAWYTTPATAASVSEIVVDKSFHVTLLRGTGDTTAFPDATGTTGENSTPIGTYKVTAKQADPYWHWEGKVYPPYLRDQNNGLGIRWIGISLPSYGLHGTNDPFSVGKDVSHGCVRHQNADISRVFAMVPSGIPVKIVETPVPQGTEAMVTDFFELYDLAAVLRGPR
ncbi:MAG TPA: L,D-transpeptidase [Candidatus Cryosericum sp.]|nr:L,D-transpeptidase [Candidatus Cryosericum sp.]